MAVLSLDLQNEAQIIIEGGNRNSYIAITNTSHPKDIIILIYYYYLQVSLIIKNKWAYREREHTMEAYLNRANRPGAD